MRAAVATRTLDNVVIQHIKLRIEDFTLEGESWAVKDIILPGGMKALLAKVAEAETAATRSQINILKVMEHNPTALRPKGLETQEKVSKKIDTILVSGRLDDVLKDPVKTRFRL